MNTLYLRKKLRKTINRNTPFQSAPVQELPHIGSLEGWSGTVLLPCKKIPFTNLTGLQRTPQSPCRTSEPIPMTSPYLRVFMEGGELQGRMLKFLLHLPPVWSHCYGVSLGQEVKGGERILLNRNTVSIPAVNHHHQHTGSRASAYLHFLLVRNLVLPKWFLEAVGWGVVFRSWGGLLVKVQLGHQWVTVS